MSGFVSNKYLENWYSYAKNHNIYRLAKVTFINIEVMAAAFSCYHIVA
ncbi:MAG: hypothetical protein OFPI_24380 [Osedax symbiont Rs2]|nr:MAG: hypothetical protein OFPI_24380 [Osedax symbiont Rs2]